MINSRIESVSIGQLPVIIKGYSAKMNKNARKKRSNNNTIGIRNGNFLYLKQTLLSKTSPYNSAQSINT